MTENQKEQADFSSWEKVDLRVGKILKVDDIEGADKLYKLIADFGKEIGKRTLVAGLKKHYEKEELKGKKFIFLANLEPKTFKGIKSEGMILAAVSDDEKEVVLIQPEREIEAGSRVR